MGRSYGERPLQQAHRLVHLSPRVPREHLSQFLEDAPALGIKGLSVTIPHKEAVLKKLTRMEHSIAMGLLDPFPDPVCGAVIGSWPRHYVRYCAFFS
jgi:hypothetical protein